MEALIDEATRDLTQADLLEEVLTLRERLAHAESLISSATQLKLNLNASVAKLVAGDPQFFLEHCVGAVANATPTYPGGPVTDPGETVGSLLQRVAEDTAARYRLPSNILRHLQLEVDSHDVAKTAYSIIQGAVEFLQGYGIPTALAPYGGLCFYRRVPEAGQVMVVDVRKYWKYTNMEKGGDARWRIISEERFDAAYRMLNSQPS